MINTDKLHEMFDELVPREGKAATVAGEIIRATMKICYRFYNDGDHIGVDYGNETCNAPARYLMEKLPEKEGALIAKMWGTCSEDVYESLLGELVGNITAYIESNPQLKSEENSDDMLDYEEDSDSDYIGEDDEDEYDYYEDDDEEYDDEEYDD